MDPEIRDLIEALVREEPAPPMRRVVDSPGASRLVNRLQEAEAEPARDAEVDLRLQALFAADGGESSVPNADLEAMFSSGIDAETIDAIHALTRGLLKYMVTAVRLPGQSPQRVGAFLAALTERIDEPSTEINAATLDAMSPTLRAGVLRLALEG